MFGNFLLNGKIWVVSTTDSCEKHIKHIKNSFIQLYIIKNRTFVSYVNDLKSQLKIVITLVSSAHREMNEILIDSFHFAHTHTHTGKRTESSSSSGAV